MTKTNLLAAKLHIPPLPTNWVRRSKLMGRLTEGLNLKRKMTLVSAPAGFGKTTCISEWIASPAVQQAAWLDLDESDNDPGRFLSYFIAALQGLNPKLGLELSGVLRSGQVPPAELVSTNLINETLELGDRFILVLDNFHTIHDDYILQVLENFIANLPQSLHIVLVTREDPPLPLARLRASNMLTEIRARDLRFSESEPGQFLSKVMGLSLSGADIAALARKTEGWIAGLQLAGLSVRDRTDPSAFIAGLSGGHHFILSYLSEQVLNHQPDETRDFLLQTSILEKLHGDLCDAVTGRSDGRQTLARLYSANLFLVPLDDEHQWYRYHNLFADFLRDIQSTRNKSHNTELHARAASWYAQAGMPSEAIQHALAAQAYALAVDLLEKHALRMIMQGFAKTVHAWVQALPQEWEAQSPRTNLAFAWMHLLRGDYAKADPFLARLQASFSSDHISPAEKDSIEAEWLVMQSLRQNMDGNLAQSLALGQRAVEIAPEDDRRVRSLAFYCLASAYQASDLYEPTLKAYQHSIQLARGTDNLIPEMMATSGLSQLAFEHGQLRLAHDIAAPVVARIERSGALPPISTVVYGILGEVHYQWYQIEDARRYTQRALQLSILGGFQSGMIGCRMMISRQGLLDGDLESAVEYIGQAGDMLQEDTPDYLRQETVAMQVKVYLANSQADTANIALQNMGFSFRKGFKFPEPADHQSFTYSLGMLYNSAYRYVLHQARFNEDLAGLEAAVHSIDNLVEHELNERLLPVVLEALLLRAQMHALLGNHTSSRVDIAKVLGLAKQENFISVFIEQGPQFAKCLADLIDHNQLEGVGLEYAERILEVFSTAPSPDPHQPAPQEPSTPLVEALTERELDVLRLMADGLKYREIADRLYISMNTVRSHTKAIYAKLNVSNRTKAVLKARRLRIL